MKRIRIEVDREETAANMRNARIAMGLRQKDVAELANIGLTSVANYEKGEFLPGAEAAIALSELFGTTVNELISYRVVRE